MAYKIFEDLQAEGVDVCFVNLIAEYDAAYLREQYGERVGNPKQLANVHNLILERAPYYPSPAHPNLAALINELAPDLLIGIGYIAALLLKASAPASKLIFITTGCDQAKTEIATQRAATVSEILARQARQQESKKFHLRPPIVNDREQQAIDSADLILVHSEMTRALFHYYFRSHTDKVFPETLWLAEWICKDVAPYTDLRKGFSGREIDLLFIASGWQRPEKNWAFVRELIQRQPNLNIHVVGRGNERIGKATYHGLVTDRSALFALLGNTRALVSPSRFDTAPGVLFEAVVMGCNVIASKNCGNWELVHPDLLVHSFRVSEFVEKIPLARAREYRHHLESFMNPPARQTLLEILDVF